MPRTRGQIQTRLLTWMSAEDNQWTIWYGNNLSSAVQLLNRDGSNVYTRLESAHNTLLILGSHFTETVELYRITWVPDNDIQEPDSNTGWWLSSDNGLNRYKLKFVKKESRAKRSHFHIYLRRG